MVSSRVLESLRLEIKFKTESLTFKSQDQDQKPSKVGLEISNTACTDIIYSHCQNFIQDAYQYLLSLLCTGALIAKAAVSYKFGRLVTQTSELLEGECTQNF